MTADRIRRMQWTVRLVLVLGAAASVTANVLHAQPNPIGRGIAAWPPLALLLTVELVSRIPVSRAALSVARLAATAAIAGIAAWVSYWHMAAVVARYGEVGAAPYLLPLSVDGLIVVASVCLVELGDRARTPVRDVAHVAHLAPPAPLGQPAPHLAAAPLGPDRPPARRPRKGTVAKQVVAALADDPDLTPAEIAARGIASKRHAHRVLTEIGA